MGMEKTHCMDISYRHSLVHLALEHQVRACSSQGCSAPNAGSVAHTQRHAFTHLASLCHLFTPRQLSGRVQEGHHHWPQHQHMRGRDTEELEWS